MELEKSFMARFTKSFQDMFSGFETFKSKIQVEEKHIPTSSHCVPFRSEIRNDFVPEFSENTPEIRISMFFTLAHIDWNLAVERLVSDAITKRTMENDLFCSLVNTLRFRLHLTQACSIIKTKCAEDGSLTEACIQEFESLLEIICTENQMIPLFHQKRRRQVFLRLREGLRWLKLKSLVGEEEVYLVENLTNDRMYGPPQLFDISIILEHGNDAEFDRAIKLFETYQPWIRKTCMDLRGTVDWITDIMEVSDRDTALSLSQLIQKNVDCTFQLNDRPSKCDTRFRDAVSLFGYNLSACTHVLFERRESSDFKEATDGAEDDAETALLIKSTQKLLRELRSADKTRADA